MEEPRDVKPGVARRPKSSSLPLSCLERLPLDTLMKVLSYLDASMLFSLCHVSRFFNEVANNNELWKSRYIADFGSNEMVQWKFTHKFLLKMAPPEVQENAAAHWRKQYFRTVAIRDMNKGKRHLRLINSYNGLPSKTEYVLRSLIQNWELTIVDHLRSRTVLDVNWVWYSETSVTLCWNAGGTSPTFNKIAIFNLHGVRRIPFNCPGLDEPIWKSLILRENVETLTPTAQVIGKDSTVEMRLLKPDIIVGLWRKKDSQEHTSIVFVMFTLHFHRLVEKSIMGSSLCPHVEPVIKPPADDVDPEYGLHSYQLHLLLHDSVSEIMSERFTLLSCKRAEISDGFIKLTAIKESNLVQHKPLSGDIKLAWRCEALEGVVQNCCIMNLTLLDKFKNPFWCVSSPIYIMEERKKTISYDYDGDQLQIHFKDTEGQVKMNFAWKEDLNQFYLVSLVVYVTVCKVNEHFSRDY